MCEECEEIDTLREVYLGRRARMARTWTPRRPRAADATLRAEAVSVPSTPERALIAAE